MAVPVKQRPQKPEAYVVKAPPYNPDLDAYGLKLVDGETVPIVECPDRSLADVLADPNCRIDARLWEGRFDDNGRLDDHRVTPRLDRDRLLERYELVDESGRVDTQKLREGDWFSLGFGNGFEGGSNESPLTFNYAPSIPGPATRQQYWADYWTSSAKAFEASTHSGIARRACRALMQFPLGRGVQWKFEDDAAQDVWEKFYDGNNMRQRLRSIAYDLAVFGEQFLRYFPTKGDDERILIVRQLDPATIYEVVTDQEDVETVYYYHQQFQTRMEYYSPPKGNKAPEGKTEPGVTRYIIRQIPAEEIDHWKINVVAGEARGRSDLFPVLGDLKRVRDLITSKVISADMGNRVMAIVTAKGTVADISRVVNAIFPGGQPPAPGSVIGLNEGTEIGPFQYEVAGVRADFTYDELIDNIAAGTGIARAYLGLSPSDGSGTTQATALTTTEPSVKSFEERQDILDELLHQMKRRVMEAANIDPETPVEWIFPEIAKEDGSQKLDDLEQAMANGWISPKTAATQAAGEMNMKDYDYDEEQKQIAEAFDHAQDTDGKDDLGMDKPAQGGVIRRPMIRATSRQEPMMDPTKAQQGDDEPPGLLVGGPAGAAPGMPGAGGVQAPNQSQNGPSKNPAAANNGVRKASAETKQTREAADMHLRRTPADPEFVAHAEDYKRETEENLKRLLDEFAS